MMNLPGELAEMREARLTLRFHTDGGGYKYRGETIGISSRHFIMSTLAKLRMGSRLLIQIRVPDESRNESSDVEIMGRVICGVNCLTENLAIKFRWNIAEQNKA